MTPAERIKTRRRELGMTQGTLADIVNTTKQTIYKYENEIITNIPSERVSALAQALHTTPEELMGWNKTFSDPIITDTTVTFPIIEKVEDIYDNISLQDWKGKTVDIPKIYLSHHVGDYLVLSVNEDAMFPQYLNGDIVLIQKQNAVSSSQIAAVTYNDGAPVLRKIEYKRHEDWLRLTPVNPNYMPKKIEDPDAEDFHIIGIPKLLLRQF